MTGIDVMSRRHNNNNNHDVMHHDYLGGTGIVKSKTSIAITGSSNRNHHGDNIIKADKRHERSAKTSSSNLCVVTKSSGSGGPGGGNANNSCQATGSRKNNRQRQRPSDNKALSKSKTSKDDVLTESKNSPVPSVLPPIAIAITNSKNDERSPRVLESSASNIPPSLSLAPTRLAIRNTTSPDTNHVSAHDAMNTTGHKFQVASNNSNSNNKHGNKNNSDDHSTTNGAKRNSLSRNDTSTCIRLSTANNHNHSNANNNNNTNSSPPPRSPRLVSETSRLSPINSQDKPKVKFEKKVMKHMMDNSMPTSPRAYRLGSSDTLPQQQQLTQSSNSNNINQTKQDTKPGTTQRRPSVKSLPKLTPADEQFSIRRKIEQFRKWHEEQHADNLKRLPGDDPDEVFKNGANTNSRPSIPGLDPLVPTCSADVMDFAKLLEDKIIQNNITDENNDTVKDNGDNNNGDAESIELSINKIKNEHKKVSTNSTSKGKRNNHNNKSKNRPISGATWKTWRGINESDAYDDVKKYIDDNDLMDPEREEWIKSWIQDVGIAMSEMGDAITTVEV